MKTDQKLLEKVRLLGFPMLSAEESFDTSATLAKVVQSKELRLWEAFPVLLMNSSEKGLFDYETVKKRLKPDNKKKLDYLLLMSLVLYKTLDLKFSWTKKVLRGLPFSPEEFRKQVRNFKDKGYFKSENMFLPADRLTTTFQNYFQENVLRHKDTLMPKEEFDVEYSLSQVFSPKQKELFLKKLHGDNLSKTEKEYYSRSVRKKVAALANEKLHQLAKTL
jgi:hypothetical protein